MPHPLRNWLAAILAPLMITALGGAAVPSRTIVVLQLNLCNSGISGCFTNRSVAVAAELIRAYAPDVVALNEICSGDVSELAREFPPGSVATGFQSAPDRRTGNGTLCLNGQQFGIGLIVARKAGPTGTAREAGPTGTAETAREAADEEVDGGIYTAQDVNDPEIRAWLCVTAALVACTAHLASTSVTVAKAQCAELMRKVVEQGAIVAGDLNLRQKDVLECVPRDFARTGDGDVQYVLAPRGAGVVTRLVVDMRGTTDHPAVLGVLRAVPGDRR